MGGIKGPSLPFSFIISLCKEERRGEEEEKRRRRGEERRRRGVCSSHWRGEEFAQASSGHHWRAKEVGSNTLPLIFICKFVFKDQIFKIRM